ncbi:cytochrome P450 [Pholiota molesta]|nr:cytochrome P450 [Pholiota molesta]
MESSSGSLFILVAVSSLTVVWLAKRLSVSRNIQGPISSSFLTAPETGRDWQLNTSIVHGGIARIRTLSTYNSDRYIISGSALLVSDPKALNHILVREQDVFEEWSAFASTNALLFGDGLVATIGNQHKKQRKMLTPAFSIKHLRGMTPMFLETHISSMIQNRPKEIDVTSYLNRGGMGYSFGKLSEPNEFSTAAKDLAATVSVMVPAAPFAPLFKYLGPPGFRRFILKFIPWALLQRLVEIVNIMDDEVKKIFAAQQKSLEAGAQHEADGKDIMSILLKANSTSLGSDRMSDAELLGQCRKLPWYSIHINTTEFCIDFNNVSALPYMDAVIRETLRVYPPIPTVFRQTMQDTIVPLLHPITGVDGKTIHELHVQKGTDIFIDILGANHHPKHGAQTRATDGNWCRMTFIAGNRACIGFNFSQLE